MSDAAGESRCPSSHSPAIPAKTTPSTGEGAQTALLALIRKRRLTGAGIAPEPPKPPQGSDGR